MYNDSPHRRIKGKPPNQVWNDTTEQNIQNMKDTISNDKLFNKLTLGIGDTVRVLENKNKFDKGGAQFSKELYEVHDRERECCLLVLNLVSSTLPCIHQPRSLDILLRSKTLTEMLNEEDINRMNYYKL